MESGVREFDLRIASSITSQSDDELRLAHGNGYRWGGFRPSINGMKWKDFLQDSVNFLNANPSEFLIFYIKWESGPRRFEELTNTLKNPCVQPLLYIHPGSNQKIMETPVCNLQGKILIRMERQEKIHKKLTEFGIPSHFPNNIWIQSGAGSDPNQVYQNLIDIPIYNFYTPPKLFVVGCVCTPDKLANLNVAKLTKSCLPGIKKYLNNENKARKANVITLDFATIDLVKQIFTLNKNKVIPISTNTCTIKKPQGSCSVKDTCQCKYESKRKGCIVTRAPKTKNSACKCTVSNEDHCEGTPVYVKKNPPYKGDTSLKACEAGCGNCKGYEICDCDWSWFSCKIVKKSPSGYSKCKCIHRFTKCYGQSQRDAKHPNCINTSP